jgi:hypothetical protein
MRCNTENACVNGVFKPGFNLKERGTSKNGRFTLNLFFRSRNDCSTFDAKFDPELERGRLQNHTFHAVEVRALDDNDDRREVRLIVWRFEERRK